MSRQIELGDYVRTRRGDVGRVIGFEIDRAISLIEFPWMAGAAAVLTRELELEEVTDGVDE